MARTCILVISYPLPVILCSFLVIVSLSHQQFSYSFLNSTLLTFLLFSAPIHSYITFHINLFSGILLFFNLYLSLFLFFYHAPFPSISTSLSCTISPSFCIFLPIPFYTSVTFHIHLFLVYYFPFPLPFSAFILQSFFLGYLNIPTLHFRLIDFFYPPHSSSPDIVFFFPFTFSLIILHLAVAIHFFTTSYLNNSYINRYSSDGRSFFAIRYMSNCFPSQPVTIFN